MAKVFRYWGCGCWGPGWIPKGRWGSKGLPNKLFDYMSMGLAAIASDVRPVRRVLSETGAGMTYRDRDVGDLTRVIREGAERRDWPQMGRRGMDAVRARYNWNRDRQGLRRAIESAVFDAPEGVERRDGPHVSLEEKNR